MNLKHLNLNDNAKKTCLGTYLEDNVLTITTFHKQS